MRTPRTDSDRQRSRHATLALAVTLVWLAGRRPCLADATGDAADKIEVRYARLIAQHAGRLGALARACRSESPDLSRRIAHWLPPRPPGSLVLFVHDMTGQFDLARQTDPGAAGPHAADRAAGEADSHRWRDRFLTLRRDQADRLWELAQQAVAAEQPALACRLATEAIREHPQHAAARRALGFRQVGQAWLTRQAARQRQRGLVWHSRYGWIRPEDVERYRQGERRDGSRWIDRREDAARHQQLRTGWRIETDHFLITTNHSLEAGVRLAERLEQLDQAWGQLFAPYYATPAQWKARFAGRPVRRRRSVRHRVDYYRSRDEYNAQLRSRQPRIAMTLGIYFDQERRSCFFADEDASDATLLHEATHQLFQESRRVTRHVGAHDNFWIVEGIATYIESLVPHDGYVTVGGYDTGRLPAARSLVLDDGYYVPLAQLIRLGTEELQHRDDLRQLYSQAAGLTTFLMHGQEGRYRRALIDYLSAVYSGKADAGTLAKLTGSRYPQLDRQYRRFLEASREARAALEPSGAVLGKVRE